MSQREGRGLGFTEAGKQGSLAVLWESSGTMKKGLILEYVRAEMAENK